MLYVKNLKSLVSEDELRKVFEPYGQVGRVKKTKDYGFIHFENREDALRAMEELNGTVRCLASVFALVHKFSCLVRYRIYIYVAYRRKQLPNCGTAIPHWIRHSRSI